MLREITVFVFIFMIFVFVSIIDYIVSIKRESKYFNNGRCKQCGEKLTLYEKDPEYGRFYGCDHCDYIAWVSHDCVDKNFRKD